jgi:hypothetical protein
VSRTARTISITEYAADLARNSVHIMPGGPGTFWVEYQYGIMIRIPKFHLAPPTPNEIRQVLWRRWAMAVSYLLEPDEHHPANTWLYICTDRAYVLDKLSSSRRRNVRLGFKELRIAPLTSEQLLAHGAQAFCDTCRRVGLSGGTPEGFRQFVTVSTSLQEHVFLGAWKDNQLAAFLSILEVDDWVDIQGTYSMDALLRYKPNDTLIYSALFHYLVELRYRLVFNGISSVWVESNAAGLHEFKTKMGFEARPVYRAFVPHPLLQPLVNRLTLWGVNTALRFRSESRRLRKARGILAYQLGNRRLLEVPARCMNDEEDS